MNVLKISLKAARINAGLSRAEAAKRLGVSASTLKNWETQKSFPSVMKIAVIEELYGISIANISFC